MYNKLKLLLVNMLKCFLSVVKYLMGVIFRKRPFYKEFCVFLRSVKKLSFLFESSF